MHSERMGNHRISVEIKYPFKNCALMSVYMIERLQLKLSDEHQVISEKIFLKLTKV